MLNKGRIVNSLAWPAVAVNLAVMAYRICEFLGHGLLYLSVSRSWPTVAGNFLVTAYGSWRLPDAGGLRQLSIMLLRTIQHSERNVRVPRLGAAPLMLSVKTVSVCNMNLHCLSTVLL